MSLHTTLRQCLVIALLCLAMFGLTATAHASPGLTSSDSARFQNDDDGDGLPNDMDPDDDNDGISDENEGDPNAVPDNQPLPDDDDDGITNDMDPDDNNNAVTDEDEPVPGNNNPPAPDGSTGGDESTSGDGSTGNNGSALIRSLPVTGGGQPTPSDLSFGIMVAGIAGLFALSSIAIRLSAQRSR